MKLSYEELLKRGYSQLPSEVFKHRRFEVPRPHVTIAGMRTILHNFKEICDALNRDPRHLLKYLSREMATAGVIQGDHVIFQGRFGQDTFERLIARYTKEFVICPVCKRPDTKIVKEKRFYFLVCEACGAKSSIRSL